MASAAKKNTRSLIPSSMAAMPASTVAADSVRPSAQDVYLNASAPDDGRPNGQIEHDARWESISSALKPAASSPSLLRPERSNAMIDSFSTALGQQSLSKAQHDDLMKQLEQGATIIELDTSVIDPSFVNDRMDPDSAGLELLSQQIQEQGQLIPILVRPHPTKIGRFQTAYGHRRTKACELIGRPVKALVRELTDDELVIAQGQENNSRLNLSYIEKARFTRKLSDLKTPRSVIASALAIANVTQISWFLSLTDKIHEDIINAIGPAPTIGRRRWEELAKVLDKSETAVSKALGVIEAQEFNDLDTDERFEALVSALTKTTKPAAAPALIVSDVSGAVIAKCVVTHSAATVRFDRKADPEFSNFVIGKLEELYAEYRRPA